MWTEKQLRDLQKAGKIRGVKGFSDSYKRVIVPREKPKGIVWLDLNLALWANENCLTLEKEYKFSERKYRWDWCFPAIKTAVEYNGGMFMQKSGHSSVKGLLRDSEKGNLALVLGWRVITVTALNYTTVIHTLNQLIK